MKVTSRSGFSTIEAMFVMAILGSIVLLLASTQVQTTRCLDQLSGEERALRQAKVIMNRIMAISFRGGAGSADAGQIAETLAELAEQNPANVEPQNVYLGVPPSFRQLEAAAPMAWTYTGDQAAWTLAFTGDLDGDGMVAGPPEGDPNIVCVVITRGGRVLLRRARCALK